jgi:UDPglucose 6-dehydrogenase
VARIAIFGAGYVGLVTGACFADLGHEVVLRDVVPERIDRLRAGDVPIYEPGLAEVLERNRERLSFTLDVREAVDGAEFLYVAVGTPPTYSGDADLTAVWTVVDELPEDVAGRPLVVMKSTVPVGTGARVRARLDARGLPNVGYVSNPEFLAEGSAVADFKSPDRVVVGAFEPADAEPVVELHRGIDTEFLRTDVASAELVKLAANAFLSTRVSFINEIANVCELVGADVVDVARGVGLDHRLGPHFLRAGIGFGGSCFPKDVTALKQLAGNSGYPFLLLQAVWEVNELQKRRVVQKLQQRLGSLRGRTVALLGLSFKPNTDDTREAPSRIIAYRLLAEGAVVRAWDPVAEPADLQGVQICDSVLTAVRGADAAVIVTEWAELRGLVNAEVRDAMARPLIVDGRNLLDPAAAADAGFEYEGIGRPTWATAAASAVGEADDTRPEDRPPSPGLGGVNGNPQPSRDRELNA